MWTLTPPHTRRPIATGMAAGAPGSNLTAPATFYDIDAEVGSGATWWWAWAMGVQ